MEREIKFRGLQKDNKTFIYGDLAKMWNGIPFIMPKCFFATKDLGYDEEDPEEVKKMLNSKELALGGFIEVIPETVGQFTGLLDSKNNDIYEGDLLQDFRKKIIYECVFRENGAFEFQNKTTLNFALLHELWDNEIIGNIHETPELLNN